MGLKILFESDYEVTFMAYYRENKQIEVMKEHSYFIKEEGCLKYDRGEMHEAKISRNDLCPCGSGKKYKRCCG
jgi:SEC-C motif-containing protein